MIKAVIFGGTTEGRALCELGAANNIPIVYCVATEDGARPVESLPNVNVKIGRLNGDEMTEFLKRLKPYFVINAAHPYAKEAAENIKSACKRLDIQLIRVIREKTAEQNYEFRGGINEIISWLKQKNGNIFAATGSSSAQAFTRLPDWQNRVWMRILPSASSLRVCLDLGYSPKRIICMQGPFSEELNRAMFISANAEILVTKDSGISGGYVEKIQAATNLKMAVAVLSRPHEQDGVSLEEARKIITGFCV